MHIRSILAVTILSTAAAFAAEAPKLPAIPSAPIAKKKELLFSDDMNGAEHDKRWHRVVDTFVFEAGALKGTQTRDKDVPAANGKPEVKAHAAVYGLTVPTKDSVVEVKVKFDGCTLVDVEFDDRNMDEKLVHYGHLCRAVIRLDGVTIQDEAEGSQNQKLKKKVEEAKAANDKAALQAAYAEMSKFRVTFPNKLEAGKWYDLTVETVGQEMRVSIDGKAVAYFKSPGIGHATKSKIELGVSGKSGWFDEIKVWNAEAAR